jgi:hypothetical protein
MEQQTNPKHKSVKKREEPRPVPIKDFEDALKRVIALPKK